MTYLLLAFLAFALGLAAGWYAGVHLTCHALVDDLATLDAERSQLDADRRQLDRDRRDHLAAVELWLQVPEERVCFDLRAHKSLRSVLS